MSRAITVLLFTITCLHFSGCGVVPSQTLAVGAGGALLGAGSGAIVGSVIDNGDVLASAGLGAGIGAGVAIAGDYIYTAYKEEQEISDNNSQILKNHDEIIAGDEELQRLRREAHDGIEAVNFDTDDSPPSPYMGPTLGTP